MRSLRLRTYRFLLFTPKARPLQSWVVLDFSYKLKLNDGYDLFFGLKASGQSYSANTNGLTTFGVGADGALMDFNSRFASPMWVLGST